MKKHKENNNLYVENPTVGYQESQEQPYDRKEQPYNKNTNSYNTDDEVDANEEEIYDEKVDTKIKQVRVSSNPFTVAGTLFVFWPLGLYWMWKYKVYKKRTRIILSIVMPVYGTLRWVGGFTN